MNTRNLLNLQEAYMDVYDQYQLTEEEIAADYFYSHGLNEDGVDILIDELGVDDFVDFVYDIVEDYELNEARRSGRIEPVTKTGKDISTLKGGAKAAAIRRLRGEKEKQRASERETTSGSGMKAALRSQAIQAASARQQPTPTRQQPAQTRQNIGGSVGSILGYIGRKGREDFESLGRSMRTARQAGREMEGRVRAGAGLVGQTINAIRDIPDVTRARRKVQVATTKAARSAGETAKKAAGAAGAATGEFVKATGQGKSFPAVAGRAAGTFFRKMRNEELEIYESVLAYLLDEGYADDLNSAAALFESMSDEWFVDILDEAVNADDIRSVTRGGKTIYTKPRWKDNESIRARRKMGKEGHPNPFRGEYYGDKGDPMTREIRRNIGKLNAPHTMSNRVDPYRTIKTDRQARRDRASGR